MERTLNKLISVFSDLIRRGFLKEFEWDCYLDCEGRLFGVDELWVRIFYGGGIEFCLRKEVWFYLFSVFFFDLIKEERERYLNMKL